MKRTTSSKSPGNAAGAGKKRGSTKKSGLQEHPKKRYASPPFPAQSQQPPGIEAEMKPLPKWRGEAYKPAGKLEGRAALITGGDSGIGRAVAYFFAREGADVAIACLPEEKRDAALVRKEIEALGRRCEVIFGDLQDAAHSEECVQRTLEAFGRLDVLVHNAAWQNRKDDVTEVSERELDRTMKVNVYAYIRLARAAAPHMEPGSSIIATGSVVGLEGSARLADYSATKGAIHALTRTLADELMDRGIRVNCVAPGPVWTPLNISDTGFSAEEVREFGRKTGKSDMERPAQPEEVAPAFVFFASNADSSYITGVVLPVTGGPA
ncbi:MAG: SDR family oxidoreductase [Phycisphaerales bacterium]|nr:SDR family oxidoreductase [Phycisphaerales bacterium]